MTDPASPSPPRQDSQRVRLPIFEPKGSLNRDGSRNTIHPADVSGRFTRMRYAMFAFLIGLWAVLPWIQIGGHPAVFLDVEHRRFFLFGQTFNAQDFGLVFFLLTGFAFALIVVTALFGRAWCAYACPQTVFLEGVFRRIERLIEGPRDVRIRRNKADLTLGTAVRKVIKHLVFAAMAFLIAHIVLSYFVSLPTMFHFVRGNPLEHLEAFGWTMGLTVAMYIDFAWFREQLCLIICPYGRLQSVLTDVDTWVVGYDKKRGEPRGKASDPNAGACVDCKRCVAVCPTGIDIRDGLQLDCIGCTACIDACDEVMDKLKRPRGLIRYDSFRGLHEGTRRFFRPRLVLYGVLGVLGLGALTFSLVHTHPFEATLLRLPGTAFTLEGTRVRNAFELHLVNKRGMKMQFALAPGQEAAGVQYVIAADSIELDPLQNRTIPVFVTAEGSKAPKTITVVVSPKDMPDEAQTVQASFLAPR